MRDQRLSGFIAEFVLKVVICAYIFAASVFFADFSVLAVRLLRERKYLSGS